MQWRWLWSYWFSWRHSMRSGNWERHAQYKRPTVLRALVAHAGFEPAISALRGRRPGPLDEWAVYYARHSTSKQRNCQTFGDNRAFFASTWTNSLRNETGLVHVGLPLPGYSHVYRNCVTHSRTAYRAGAGSQTIRVSDAITIRCCRFEIPSGLHRCSSGRSFIAYKQA
jgi:hypothetical protein